MKNIKNLQTAIFLFGFLLFSANIFAQIYVKADATGSNDGTSWTNAYTDLQSALSAATTGNEIWVAAGTYKPTAGTDRLSTFLLKSNIPLYGGFFGNESNLSERNYIANQTILSGDIGTEDYNADNVYHVVYGDNSTYIDGFVIEGGNANDTGGGITYGGGLAVTTTDADMTVKNCVFRNNYAETNGAAISIASDNSNTNKFLVENCIFTNNSTPYYTGKGGAISLGLANITVVNSVFKENVARYGTAVYNGTEYNSAPKHANFINCTFFETNNAYPEIYDNYQASSFTNCIFNVKNSIFFNNNGTAKAIVNYSCINTDNLDTDSYTGSNNIFTDPLFISDTTLQLQALSPCIDNANGDSVVSPDYFGSPVYDNPFVSNTGVGTPDYADMGANEFYTDKMIGYYTIGSTGDYANFTAALNDLNTLGVGGPVIFNVQSGTYNEQLTINEITGASETNTITFQSESGDSTDVILSYAANSTNNYTVKLNGADFIRFKNMTLQATDNTYARIVELSGGACQNHFSNNRFIGVANSSELVYSYNTSNQTTDIDTNNVFVYNRFTNGQRAISLTTNLYHLSTQTNISIHHNEFINQTDKAVYLNYCSHSSIKNNSFTSNTSSTGIYLTEFSSGDTISTNNIQLNSGGVGIDINHCYRVSNDTSLVDNNFIYLNTTNADIGINIYSTYTALKVLYNTINITGNNTGSVAIKRDAYVSSQKTPVILNNIFSNKANGLASSFNYSVNSDYNCFYTTGQYLINNNSLESWQDSQNQDTNSVEAKPYFIADNNWQAENLKLNGSATPLTDVNTDIDDEIRDTQNPDIGCNEFTPTTTPMHGTYTIGGSSPDFSTINTAIDNLIIKGVDGTVTFNIATGTYTEQISIPEVIGASATNTITFQSATGDSTDVVINYAPSETYKDYTLLLNGADYMIFKYVSIANNGASWGVPIEIRKEACFNRFESSKIYFSDDNTTSTLVYFGFDENNINYTDSNNVFNNCYFEKGKYAIDCYTSAFPKNTGISDNTFINNALRIYKGEAYNISKNHFNITATADNTMAVYSNDNSFFANNMIVIDNTANYGNCYGIDSYGTNNEIYYNSIKITGNGTPISTGDNAIIKNNVLIADNSGCLAVGTNGSDIDYNTYYKPTVYGLINNNLLEDWQQNTGFDMHSIYKNIDFVSDTDLHTSDPWVNNRGIAITGITEDIDGNSRNTTPDIGACEFNGQMPLSGVYTIGSGGDFDNFSEAVDSLNFCGVKDSVIFKVLDGTYTEQFRLTDTLIYRLPDTAQIVFESQSGNNTSVVLQYDATVTDDYVVYLDSVSDVNIKNLNIKTLNQVNSVAVLMKECYKDTISGNIIEGNGQTMPVILSTAPTGNENVIANNNINNGKIGILLNNGTTNLSEHNYIIDNTFNNQYSGGIFAKYQKFAHIERNQIYKTTAIEDTTWVGIGLISCDGSYSESGLTANNMISFNASDKSAGIHLYASNHQKIYYNSVNIFGNTDKSRAFNQESGGTDNDLKNNIFYNNANGLVYYIANSNAFSSDYNDMLTNGSNFAYNAGTYINTKDDWVSSVNKDQNSVSVNPQYTADDDLHINELSIIAKGIPVAEVSKDIDGNIRDTEHPTIGADKIAGNCSGPLAGTYTIGTSGNYPTFNDAVIALLSCGVSSSVTFDVISGTYNEQIYLPANIPGYTPNDSIVFQSETGNNNDVTLQYDADATKNYVVALDAAQNIHFKNMTIQAINTTYGSVIALENSVFANFDNNRIIGVISSNEDNQTACIYYTGNEDDTLHITLSNNLIQNGSSGFLMENCNNVKSTVDINQNTFDNQNYVGIKTDFYTHTGDSFIEITANTIQSNRAIENGIYISSGICNISSNRINIETTSSCTGIESMAIATVDNNFISINANSNTAIPIKGYYSNNKSNLYFNSIYLHGNETSFSSCVHINDSNGPDSLYNNCLINLNTERIIYSDISYSNFYMDNNNLYSTSSYFNFNDAVNTLGGNTHSVSFMPNFVSETDLHVQDLLLYRNGINIPETTTDIDGETRNNPPCIGADEFTSPEFNIGADIDFCYNDENIQYSGAHIFDIGIGYDSYQWSNGSDSSSVLIDSTYANTGNNEYVVTVTTGGNSYTDTINILYDLPDAISETEYCFWNSPINITANQGFDSYLWNIGNTTQDITVNSSGTYSITVTDSYGCKAKESIHIDGASNYSPYNNYPADLGDDLTACSSQSTQLLANKYTDNDVYAHYSFVWNNSDTTQSITVDNSLTGDNTFIATVALRANNLCHTSDTITVTIQECTGFDEVGKSDLLIYPNPANNQFVIKGDIPESINVLSCTGQVVIEKNIVQTPTTVDVSSLKSGIYFIELKYGQSVQVKKLIIRH